jgi:hypothetical protein
MRPLRIELRRSAATWVGLLLLLVSLGMFYITVNGPWWKTSYGWHASWTTLSLWVRSALQMMLPLALGLGAWQGRRDRRATMDELLATMPTPAWRRALWPAGAMLITAVGAYVLFFVVGAIQVRSYFQLTWLLVTVVGVLAIVAFVLLGMAIGRLLPALVTAPVLAILGLLGLLVMQGTPDQTGYIFRGAVSWAISLLSPYFDGPHDAVSQISTNVSILQTVWLLGLIATAFLLFIAVTPKARALALIPAVVGAAIAVPLLPNDKASVIVPDQETSALVCTADLPRVCVTHIHEEYLPRLVGPAREALTVLAKLPNAPTSVEEKATPWSYHQTLTRKPGVTLVDDNNLIFAGNLRDKIVAGEDVVCDDLNAMFDADAAHAVATAWLIGAPVPVDTYGGTPRKARELWASLQSLPASAQPARVAELRDTTCAS